MPIPLLVVIEYPPASLARIEAAGFELHIALTPSEQKKVMETVGADIRAVLTNPGPMRNELLYVVAS